MARYSEDSLTVRHDDVFALACNPEAGLFEGSHSIEMIDAGNLGHGLHRDFDFANLFALELFFNYGQVLSDCVPDVFERFRLGSSLRPTPR